MTDLSPAAQKVLDAVQIHWEHCPVKDQQYYIACSIRAAVDLVVAMPPKNWELISCVSSRELEIRNQLLAIADELESQS